MRIFHYCGLYTCFLFTSPLQEQAASSWTTNLPLVALRMKGLMKGFRYFSNMFEEKEPEIQIGNPTDVKHVAHIGIDGPATNKPTWMNEFNANPEVSSSQINTNKAGKPPSAGNQEQLPAEKPKKSRRKASTGGGESPPKDKKNRRNRASNVSTDSDRGRQKKGGASMDSQDGTGMNSPGREMDSQSDIPKKNGRKKEKSSGASKDPKSSFPIMNGFQ